MRFRKRSIDEWQAFARTVIKTQFERQKLNFKLTLGRVTALIGVRRSGKTFYAIELAQNYISSHKNTQFLYINFEDPYFLLYKDVIELDLLLRTYAEYNDGCEMAVDFTPNSGGTLQAMAHVLYNYTKH
jgi:predicted AAA+ superfamily ATPase